MMASFPLIIAAIMMFLAAVPTWIVSLANGFRSPKPIGDARLPSSRTGRSAGGVALSTSKERTIVECSRSRYLAPETPVAERINELILAEQGREDVLLDRQQQAEWLKQAMASRWGAHLPQPFIGFDLDDGLFIASWQSDCECNTLTIDARERKGWYDPWPAGADDNPIPEEIDLDTEEAWQRLRTALTTIRP